MQDGQQRAGVAQAGMWRGYLVWLKGERGRLYKETGPWRPSQAEPHERPRLWHFPQEVG